MRELNVLIG